MAAMPEPVIARVTFQRTLELARAALAGCECLALTLRFGLAMPREHLEQMSEAIDMARRELDELDAWAAGPTDSARVQ